MFLLRHPQLELPMAAWLCIVPKLLLFHENLPLKLSSFVFDPAIPLVQSNFIGCCREGGREVEDVEVGRSPVDEGHAAPGGI